MLILREVLDHFDWAQGYADVGIAAICARRKKLWAEVEADDATPDLTAISDNVEAATAEDVRQALSSLTPETRSVAILIDIEEFTIAEAAAMLRIPPGTAASRLSRARRELRELLQAYRSGSSRREGKA